MATYGWVTIAEADTYFSTRLGSGILWDSGTEKESALTTAYNQLQNSGTFTLPTTATTAMKYAQYEQALFLLQHNDDIMRRKGLQAQGVTQAGIVQESYTAEAGKEMAICPMALQLLSAYKTKSHCYKITLTRDDEEDV
jgi:hypothetical protein